MSDLAAKRKGVAWKPANLNGLSKDTKRLFDAYKSEYNKAQEAGKALRSALNKEWSGHYPDGKDGKVCTFNVINGVVIYAWVDKPSSGGDGEMLFP